MVNQIMSRFLKKTELPSSGVYRDVQTKTMYYIMYAHFKYCMCSFMKLIAIIVITNILSINNILLIDYLHNSQSH